ncbi:MAG: alpha/beta fold hydrolase [Acidimicrobiales bacterium]
MTVELRERESGTGRLVVLVHGQPGRAAGWDRLVLALQGSHRVLRYDRPGWGESEGPAVGIAGNALALRGLLESRLSQGGAVSGDAGGPTCPAVLVGHSLGAAIAVSLAQRYPGLVGALVLVNPSVTPASLGRLDRLLASAPLGDGLALAGFVAADVVLSLIVRHREGLPEGVRRLASALPAGVLAAADDGGDPPSGGGVRWPATRRRGGGWRSFVTEQRALLREAAGIEAALGEVAAPAVVVGGTRDRLVPARSVRALAGALPVAELRWLDGGHLLPWEAPARLAEVVGEAGRLARASG